MSLLLAAAVAQVALARPRFDHTDDVAVVARFLADVRVGKSRGDGIEVKNWLRPGADNFNSFVAYANDCQIERIYAVPSTTRQLPLGVEWDCGRYIKVANKPVWEERFASVWVANGRVVKVSIGKPPPVVIPPMKAKPNG